MYGHMTHHLTALAGGRVVVALEGGYNLVSIAESATACAKALLGDPLPPVKVKIAWYLSWFSKYYLSPLRCPLPTQPR